MSRRHSWRDIGLSCVLLGGSATLGCAGDRAAVGGDPVDAAADVRTDGARDAGPVAPSPSSPIDAAADATPRVDAAMDPLLDPDAARPRDAAPPRDATALDVRPGGDVATTDAARGVDPAPPGGGPIGCYGQLDGSDGGGRTTLAAVDHAIDYLTAIFVPPDGYLFFDTLYRRYGVTPFASASADYDAVLSAAAPANEPYLRVFRRIIDPDNVLEAGDIDSIGGGVDALTVPALYCDREPVAVDYAQTLADARDQGGYLLTHAGLALGWIEENGCVSPGGSAFRASVEVAMAALVQPSDGVTDLEIEAMMFILYLGRADLFEPSWRDALLLAQRPNGGWSEDPAISMATNYHATELAVFTLLALACPEARGPIVSQVSQ